MGDIFASPPIGRYCGGRGYGSNAVAGRIGATQSNSPYSALASSSRSARCDDTCTLDPSGDGYAKCVGVSGNPITVWRAFNSAPALSFESSLGGFTNNVNGSVSSTSLGLSADQHLSGTHSMLLTVNASRAGKAFVELKAPGALVQPGKNMTFFIKIPTGRNWSFVQAYAQDGPARNYRWSQMGLIPSQMLPTEWTSVVVKIPSDFSATGGKIGVQLDVTGPGTVQLYVDSLFFDS